MITYQAAAMGMALLTTPMGAGGIIRDGIHGIVHNPHDRQGWIDALRMLASSTGNNASTNPPPSNSPPSIPALPPTPRHASPLGQATPMR
jgi:hypothetical protein